MLFGLIYSGTVATLPKTMFMIAAGILVGSLALMFLVKPAFGERYAGKNAMGNGNGKIAKKAKRVRREERGRSRVSKDLRKGT